MKPRRPLRDPKTALQEWAQARGLDTPIYREAGRSGPAHAPKFVIEVEVAGFAPTQAEGASKRLAEQAAARAFMAREGVDNRERAGS
jgi:ribonuclease-3